MNDIAPPSPRLAGIVAVFASPDRAEAAVGALLGAGFDARRLSIVATDRHSGEHLLGVATGGGRVRFWGRCGSTWDRLAQRLPGAATVFAPFLGYVVVLGALAGALVDDRPQHGAVEGATPLWRLLARIGIPSREALSLESALREDDILLLAAGAPADLLEARNLLRETARQLAR
jgi:hypothetical protein